MVETKSLPPEFYSEACKSGANLQVSLVPRNDQRKPDEQRKIFMKMNTIGDADGSAYIEMGETKVICSIHGPHEIDRMTADYIPPDFDIKGTFSAKISFAPFATKLRLKRNPRHPETETELSLSRAIIQAFSPAIRFDKYPKSQIDARIKILEDDGSALSAAIICCTLALIDAGIEIYDVVLSSSCTSNDDATFFDPNFSEEQTGAYGVTVALMPSLNQISLVHQVGDSNPSNLPEIIKRLSTCCYRVYPPIKAVITQEFKKTSAKEINESC